MGISNTVVCADCGFIFEIIRGPLGSKIEENQSDEGSFDQPEFDSPEPLDQGTELEEKESEEREISKAKRSTGRINRNREEEKEEKSDKSDKKKRFALQRPDIIPSNTYAAPLKEIQKILEKEEPVKPKANVLPKQEPRVAPNFVPGNVSVIPTQLPETPKLPPIGEIKNMGFAPSRMGMQEEPSFPVKHSSMHFKGGMMKRPHPVLAHASKPQEVVRPQRKIGRASCRERV